MPPYLAFHLKKVALLIPCLRQTSAVFTPASCSRSTPMICSSVNPTASSSVSFQRPDSTQIWRKFRGSGQRQRRRSIYLKDEKLKLWVCDLKGQRDIGPDLRAQKS